MLTKLPLNYVYECFTDVTELNNDSLLMVEHNLQVLCKDTTLKIECLSIIKRTCIFRFRDVAYYVFFNHSQNRWNVNYLND